MTGLINLSDPIAPLTHTLLLARVASMVVCSFPKDCLRSILTTGSQQVKTTITTCCETPQRDFRLFFQFLKWEYGGCLCDLFRMICQGQTFFGEVCLLRTHIIWRRKRMPFGAKEGKRRQWCTFPDTKEPLSRYQCICKPKCICPVLCASNYMNYDIFPFQVHVHVLGSHALHK